MMNNEIFICMSHYKGEKNTNLSFLLNYLVAKINNKFTISINHFSTSTRKKMNTLLATSLCFLDKIIEEGSLDIKVTTYIFGFPVSIEEEFDICIIANSGCPVKGNAKVNFELEIPNLATNVSVLIVQSVLATKWPCTFN